MTALFNWEMTREVRKLLFNILPLKELGVSVDMLPARLCKYLCQDCAP